MGTLTVKAASKLAGINPHTLRAWERRYRAIAPERSGTGRRLYSLEEVVRIRMLSSVVRSGHPIREIANLSNDELKKLLALKPTEESPSTEVSNALDQLIGALSEFKLGKVNQDLNRARVAFSSRVFLLQIVVPLLREVGALVHQGRLSIAQEHALCAILRHHLGQMLHSFMGEDANLPSNTPRIALATVEGDLHEFPILIASVLCANYGIVTHMLGANLPAASLAEACKALRTTLVILGASPIHEKIKEGALASYLKIFDEHLPSDAKLEVWVGGPVPPEAFALKARFPLRKIESLETLDATLKGLGSRAGSQ
jgi:DNA-binding transcriptional MerR regulator